MDDLSPSCTACGQRYTITRDDLQFYTRISPIIGGRTYAVPPPTRCPDCRLQRRISFRNERTYYRRPCALSGKSIMSIYSPRSPVTVYEYTTWHSDDWDPLSYGRPFNFSRPFFEQFFELHREVPLMSLDVKCDNENCDYGHLVSRSKNCYYVVASLSNEDCLYSTYLQRNRSVADCLFIFDSELCYECLDCFSCYRLFYSQHCINCSDSYGLYSCRACRNCVGCVSLVNKEHCIFNKQFSPGEYEKKLGQLLRYGRLTADTEREIRRLCMTAPQKAIAGMQNENVSGDHISHSRNSFDCFDCTAVEDCRYCTWWHHSNDCMDCYGWGFGELGYENHLVGNSFNRVLFCDSCWEGVSNLLYCRLCINNCHDLFGCVGLRGKSHCILNRQYSVHEYESLAARIIAHMRETGEWGEFFPAHYSPFAYNETVAHECFPLRKDEALRRGLRWEDDLPGLTGQQTVDWTAVPQNIAEVASEISNEVLSCERCARNYRVTALELRLYRDMQVPLPRACFHCRHQRRAALRNPRRLYERRCGCCGAGLLSTYGPGRPELIYCEECYLREVQ